MTDLPTVVVAPDGSGWTALCSCGGFRLWCATRPPVDLEAERHRAKCATKSARRDKEDD